MHYEEDRLATMAEADAEYARNVGFQRRDQAWILSDRDVWYANPFYRGLPVPHPESGEYEVDSMNWAPTFKEASETARKLAAQTGQRAWIKRWDDGFSVHLL